MPPRKRTTTAQFRTIDVGGVEVTADEIRAAIDILTSSQGVMVKQPLARSAHPLAECAYHQIANFQRDADGDRKQKTKPAFVTALEAVLSSMS